MRLLRRILANVLFCTGIVFTAAVVTIAALIAHITYQPRTIEFDPYACLPKPEFVRGQLTIPYTSRYPVAEVASYDDAVEAFLRFQFLRGRVGADGVRVLLTASTGQSGRISYRVMVVGHGDLLTDIPRLGRLEGRRLIPPSEMVAHSHDDFSSYQHQSHIFETAQEVPAKQTLEALQPAQLKSALSSFLMFKSQTDIRVLQDMEPRPQPLTRAQAEQSATDILAVARFYDLPLDYFVGVGAMENNYMDVNGDLAHTVWKHRAQSGDIVVQRRKHSVLVSNYSVGPWQITRETIRAAHALYLRDKRDYTLLPERLRPARQLDLDAVTGPTLTTYAGLLLRELLDHFQGDVHKAIGAYNGGTVAPNLQYASAVAGIAEYARRVLEHAPLPELPAPETEIFGTIELAEPVPAKIPITGETLLPVFEP